MQTDFDLIIVGAGLAGNCLALALKDSGLKLAIVEASNPSALRDAPQGERALALAAGTIILLESLQAWSGIAAKASPIKRIHVSDRGHFGKTRITAREQGVDALGYVILARDIEQHMAELVEQCNITRYFDSRVAGLISGLDAINISLKQYGKSINLSAQLLVGADGGQSTVRKLLEIPQQISDYGQTALVTTVESSLPHADTAYERFTASGPLAFLPIKSRLSSVVWTRTHEQAEELISASETEFLNELQCCFGYRLGALKLVAPRRAFPLSLVRAEKMVSDRCVIIGNAAHQLHPVAGQGFNLGIRDVAELAQMLNSQALRNADLGDAELLSGYVSSRQHDHDKTIGFTNNLVGIFSTNWLPLVVARNFGLNLLDQLPSVKRLLGQHAMGLANSSASNVGKTENSAPN
jgi:2-octaprenyl-6-methoxyphenol hydroxylase